MPNEVWQRIAALEKEVDRLQRMNEHTQDRYQKLERLTVDANHRQDILCMILKEALGIVAQVDAGKAKELLAKVPAKEGS